MESREQIELRAILKKVVDVLHLLACLFGTLAVVVGGIRNHALGSWSSYPLVVTMLLVVLVGYLVRHRIPLSLRSGLLLGSIGGAGFLALFSFGIMAQGGVLLPTVVVISWMIWSRPMAWWTIGLAQSAFVAAAVKNIVWGGIFAGTGTDPNRMLVSWIAVWVVYCLVGALIMGATRVLLGSVRTALDRTTESEALAKEEKGRLDGILKGVNDAIFLHDLDSGRILETFGRFAEMYGYTQAQILMGDVGMLSAGFAPWTKQDALAWIDKCVEEGPQSFNWRAKRADGELFWVEVAMQTIAVQGQQRLLVTVRDIDHLMQAQTDLAMLNADLERRVVLRTKEIEQAREAMESFSYSVSHDLRAPLRAIDGFARVLDEDFGGSLPDDARLALGRILAGAGRMGRLIDALLSLSRLDSLQIKPRLVDVEKLVVEVMEVLRAGGECRIDGAGPDKLVWEKGPLPALESDPDLVWQVFSNLIYNSCKFTRSQPVPRIRISAVERSDGLWYQIADNGIGFDMAYADRLYKVFQRLHGEDIEGLGIGLATVKKVIDRLGGAIEAESAPGEGATFRFRLAPAVRVDSSFRP